MKPTIAQLQKQLATQIEACAMLCTQKDAHIAELERGMAACKELHASDQRKIASLEEVNRSLRIDLARAEGYIDRANEDEAIADAGAARPTHETSTRRHGPRLVCRSLAFIGGQDSDRTLMLGDFAPFPQR